MKRTVNRKALKRILKQVKKNPQHWDQESWHCGTSHCFAGFAVLDKFKLPIDTKARKIAKLERDYLKKNNLKEAYIDSPHTETSFIACDYLGLTVRQSDNLFNSDNSLEDLERKVKNLCKEPKNDKKAK